MRLGGGEDIHGNHLAQRGHGNVFEIGTRKFQLCLLMTIRELEDGRNRTPLDFAIPVMSHLLILKFFAGNGGDQYPSPPPHNQVNWESPCIILVILSITCGRL